MRLSPSPTSAWVLVSALLALTATQPLHVSADNSVNIPVYKGCYDNSGTPVLPSSGLRSGTIEGCRQQCRANGFKYTGMDSGSVCSCGSDLLSTAVIRPDSECNSPCILDSQEMCGGTQRMSVYLSTYPASQPATVGNWTSQGCYYDNAATHVLSYGYGLGFRNSITTCSQACAGWNYFGVEGGDSCYCGNTLPQTAQQAPASACSKSCVGDETQLCGANQVMGIYTSIAPQGKLPTTAKALGCFSSQYGPALYYPAYKNNATNTPLGCLQTCSAKGFQYSGVQNGGSCYCDTSIQLAMAMGANAMGCTTPCTGLSSLTCGGNYKMQIAQDTLVSPSSLGWWPQSAVFKRDD